MLRYQAFRKTTEKKQAQFSTRYHNHTGEFNVLTFLRGVLVLLLAPVLTGLVSIVAIIMIVVFRRSAADVQFLPRTLGRIVARLSGVSVSMTGAGLLEQGRPYIFAANHQSQFDIFVLQGYLGCDFRWLAKLELFKIPVFGKAMQLAGYIPVDRTHGRKALQSLDEAARRITDGKHTNGAIGLFRRRCPRGAAIRAEQAIEHGIRAPSLRGEAEIGRGQVARCQFIACTAVGDIQDKMINHAVRQAGTAVECSV